MMNLAAIIKRQAETLTHLSGAVLVIGTAYSGIVHFSGGEVIPFATHKEVDALLEKRDAAVRCKDLNGRLRRAQVELAVNPTNGYAMSGQNDALDELADMPDCKVISLRRPGP